jgi:ATP-binding cassette subfamily F protein uup
MTFRSASMCLGSSVERKVIRVELGKGRELTASQWCERLGFGADAQWTPVSDLSGGERRRLQLTRLLMGGPNVLVLDEPTNDFDVETLTALEDLLDGFAGTLLVISHDRYFLERVCDDFVALFGDERISSLIGGIDEYLSVRSMFGQPGGRAASAKQVTSAAEQRAAAKDLSRVERSIVKLDAEERKIHAQMAENPEDHEALARLGRDLKELTVKKGALEEEWLGLSEALS